MNPLKFNGMNYLPHSICGLHSSLSLSDEDDYNYYFLKYLSCHLMFIIFLVGFASLLSEFSVINLGDNRKLSRWNTVVGVLLTL